MKTSEPLKRLYALTGTRSDEAPAAVSDWDNWGNWNNQSTRIERRSEQSPRDQAESS